MNNIQTVNGILAIISFVLLFCSLVLDFADKRNSSIVRRVVMLFMLLCTCSVLIRVGEGQVHHVVVLWFAVTVFIFISKLLQYIGKTKAVDDKINRIANSIGKSSAHKRAAH